MSGDVMQFPPSWEDFAEQYSITDSEEVYTNGSKLVPLFRVHQMVKHYFADAQCKSCLMQNHLREERLRKPIVRCRDCKDFDPNENLCVLEDGDGGFEIFQVRPDGFCAWGERRES